MLLDPATIASGAGSVEPARDLGLRAALSGLSLDRPRVGAFGDGERGDLLGQPVNLDGRLARGGGREQGDRLSTEAAALVDPA
jgi:hypothetical protein